VTDYLTLAEMPAMHADQIERDEIPNLLSRNCVESRPREASTSKFLAHWTASLPRG
jgi:hypothetical protein